MKNLRIFSFALVVVLAGCTQGGRQEPTIEVDAPEASGSQPIRPQSPQTTDAEDRVGAAAQAVLVEPVLEQTLPVVAAKRPPAGQSREPVPLQGGGLAPPIHTLRRQAAEPPDREEYHHFQDGGTFLAKKMPVSTFSIDVDTGSYAVVRRMLNQGRLPVRDAVRIEEMVNYFDYSYPTPDRAGHPFAVHTELGPSPWNEETRLLKIGIQGWQAEPATLPPANLVFLVDVSGSMRHADKLDLLKTSLRLLVSRLRAEDRIAIAVYAGASGLVLPSTPGDRKATILAALDGLTAGGSTHGAAGIRLAYQVARDHFIDGGINRVLLATDGDFNVGTVDTEALKDLVARQRESGVALTTLGFGSGNYNDHLMEQIADIGNGNYAYIDRLSEARKVLIGQMAGTLHTIARDVKIQIEFNPALVQEYRLVGYENRVLRREDFHNDRVDAGDIGEGHHVTAIYEVRLADDETGRGRMDPLRYVSEPVDTLVPARGGELAYLKLRYKQPGQEDSVLVTHPVFIGTLREQLAETSEGYRFAAAVAGFGQLLRGGRNTEAMDFPDVLALANGARGLDPQGYRGEFISLVQLAQALATPLRRREEGEAGPVMR